MSNEALERLLRALADEFKQRRMDRHVTSLRAFYAEHIRKRPRAASRSRASVEPFSEAEVVEWARRFQVPPHESFYVVQFRGATCHVCRTPSAVGFISELWIDGAKRECHFCKSEWVEHDFKVKSKSYAPRKDER